MTKSPAPPLTLDELIVRLQQLRDEFPDRRNRPVHLLILDEDGDHLLTHVEIDCFSEGQGPVTSLMSWPNDPE